MLITHFNVSSNRKDDIQMRKINKDTVWEILIENELVTLFQGCEKLSKVIEILELCEQEFPDIHTIMLKDRFETLYADVNEIRFTKGFKIYYNEFLYGIIKEEVIYLIGEDNMCVASFLIVKKQP